MSKQLSIKMLRQLRDKFFDNIRIRQGKEWEKDERVLIAGAITYFIEFIEEQRNK